MHHLLDLGQERCPMSLLAMLVKSRRCRVSCRISVSPSPMDATVAVSRGTGSDLPKLSSGSCRQPSNRCSPGRVDPGSFPCSSWLSPKLSPPIFGIAKKPNCRRHSRFRRSIVASGEAFCAAHGDRPFAGDPGPHAGCQVTAAHFAYEADAKQKSETDRLHSTSGSAFDAAYVQHMLHELQKS